MAIDFSQKNKSGKSKGLSMKDGFKSYGLHLIENDDPDRENIDFYVECEGDNVAYVWGDTKDNVEWECNHPIVNYDDDEPVGECLLCGCACDCHYEPDIGNVEDYSWSGRRLVPHEWYPRRDIGGLIGEYLSELDTK